MNLENAIRDFIKAAVMDSLKEMAALARQQAAKTNAAIDEDDTPVEAMSVSKRKRKSVDTTPAPESEEVALGAAEPEKAPAITYDDIKVVVLEYITKHGKLAAGEIFAQFGVAKAPELKPEQWPEVYEAFKAAL